jgi:hypothetical protein
MFIMMTTLVMIAVVILAGRVGTRSSMLGGGLFLVLAGLGGTAAADLAPDLAPGGQLALANNAFLIVAGVGANMLANISATAYPKPLPTDSPRMLLFFGYIGVLSVVLGGAVLIIWLCNVLIG